MLQFFAHCLNTFCKTVSKLDMLANKPHHREINLSHLCQMESLLSKPNNPLSKCHSEDKMVPTWHHRNTHYQISLLSIKRSSRSFSLFIYLFLFVFTSTEGTYSQELTQCKIMTEESFPVESIQLKQKAQLCPSEFWIHGSVLYWPNKVMKHQHVFMVCFMELPLLSEKKEHYL